MSWIICFPGGSETSLEGLNKVQAAVASYEGYTPEVDSAIPLTTESDLIVIVLRAGNDCRKGAVDSLAGQPVPAGDGYLVAFRSHPFFESRRMILIASESEEGLLRGCCAFSDEYLPEAALEGNPFRRGFPVRTVISE